MVIDPLSDDIGTQMKRKDIYDAFKLKTTLWCLGLYTDISALQHFNRQIIQSNYSIWIFTHLKLCLADAIHNFKWVKIIQIWQNGGQLFSNIADWCHILSLTCLKGGT